MNLLIFLIFFLFNLNVIFGKDDSFNFIEEKFQQFLTKYNKTYLTKEEYLKRLNLFNSSFYRIINHNSKNYSFKLGINHFSDLTEEEIKKFKSKKLKKIERNNFLSHTILTDESTDKDIDKEDIDIPESYDYYRDNGWVGAIKNQGDCGSCVVFSIIADVEIYYAKKTKNILKSFSEQQIIDCLYEDRNICVDGAEEKDVFEYIQENGLMETNDYPYESGGEGKVFECKYDENKVDEFTKIPGYKKVKKPKVNNIKKYIIKYGPVSSGITACQIVQDYSNGIISFSKEECDNSSDKADHDVTIVGWGIDELTEKNYWIIKNSWDDDWGDGGYGYVEIGKNVIGIENEIFYINSNFIYFKKITFMIILFILF